MQIVLTLDDSIDYYEALGIAQVFETGEYPWCVRADVRTDHCGKCAAAETGSAGLHPTTGQGMPAGEVK